MTELSWMEAPLPRRFHRCSPWTVGVVNDALIERCACGAIRFRGGSWMERNSRRASCMELLEQILLSVLAGALLVYFLWGVYLIGVNW